MEEFTPVSAIIGGLLIGAAASLLLWLNGRIAGISGIVGGALGGALGDTAPSDRAWRLTFIAGLIAAPLLLALAAPLSPWLLPLPRIEAGWPLIVAGGLLVGFGTALGSGCTSGHGVCGLARLSRRSLAATLIFMGSGAATVFVLRHLAGG